ncbi:hypothetical protein [Candidatus Paracaedibacter symbiosus]|uniref:hypothetical protein n=1 Tax=Candidatus Paracaedibacter symbiosus TaxID=244582 RepID=UPI0018DCBE35|nr:hypothetical protein [Candidatus Paracaedibacter symbiosus]
MSTLKEKNLFCSFMLTIFKKHEDTDTERPCEEQRDVAISVRYNKSVATEPYEFSIMVTS